MNPFSACRQEKHDHADSIQQSPVIDCPLCGSKRTLDVASRTAPADPEES
jgi:DNA-directed RNA polymerase subunit RPC12/RpoP